MCSCSTERRDLLAAHPSCDEHWHRPHLCSRRWMYSVLRHHFPPVLQSFVLGLVLFGTVRPLFLQPACYVGSFPASFLFVLNEQLLFFLPSSGNHRIPYPEAEWQDDGDRIHLSHVCSACGASPAYALLYRGKVQRFPGAPRVSLGSRFPLHQGLGLQLHSAAARQRVMPASS